MTDNDYIAEYIREKHPEVLGFDFLFWKIGKILVDTAQSFIKAVKEATDRYPGETEDILKKIKEAGEDEVTAYEGEVYNHERKGTE